MNFTTEQRAEIVSIPGTPYVALANDPNFTPTMKRLQKIELEDSIANLPEVQALTISDIVIDVGAFIGDTAIIFASKGAYVYAFEPQFDSFLCLLHNALSYDHGVACNRIAPIREAIGHVDGRIALSQEMVSDNPATRQVARDGESEEYVKATRIDSLGIIRPKLIKLDIEGYEPAALIGAKETIQKYHPTFIIEVYPELIAKAGFAPYRESIYQPLLDAGYEIRVAIGEEDSARWDIVATWKK